MDRAARLRAAPARKRAWLRKLSAGSPLLLLAACTTLAPGAGGIRLEDRPAEGVIRVANASGKDAVLYYNVAKGFGEGPMLFIRYRDGAGRIVGRSDGWWTLAMIISQAYRQDQFPERDKLKVPANGFVDLPRDIAALRFGRYVADRAEGPCSMQLKLVLYLGRRTDRQVEPATDWRPAPCPEPDAQRAPRP